jgi:hypothetical protein
VKKLNISLLAFALTAAVTMAGCNRTAPTDAAADTAPAARSAESAAPAPVSAKPAVALAKFGPAIPEDLMSPPAQSGGECGIEATESSPQGAELVLSRSKPEHIEGWALDRSATTASEGIYVKLATGSDASYFAKANGVVRAGLGIRLQDPQLDRAGFVVDADLADVPAGTYEVQVAQRVNGKVLLCATGRSARVVD